MPRLNREYALLLGSLVACGTGGELDPGPRCGPGTQQQGDRCVGGPICAPGAHEVDGACVAEAPSCGPGTRKEGETCVPATDGGYEIRLGTTELAADGYDELTVQVLGPFERSGEPLLLGTSPAGAGTFLPPELFLSPAGAWAWLTPCNAAQQPACARPFRITLARRDTPAEILAQSAEVKLAAPDPVASMAPCTGNVLYLNGDPTDPIHPGEKTRAADTFTEVLTPAGAPHTLELTVGGIKLIFSSVRTGLVLERQTVWLPSADSTNCGALRRCSVGHGPLARSLLRALHCLQFVGPPRSAKPFGALGPQVFRRAQSHPFTEPRHPGQRIGPTLGRCGTLEGSFQIHELRTDGDKLRTLAASFEQRCDGRGWLRGCIRVAK